MYIYVLNNYNINVIHIPFYFKKNSLIQFD